MYVLWHKEPTTSLFELVIASLDIYLELKDKKKELIQLFEYLEKLFGSLNEILEKIEKVRTKLMPNVRLLSNNSSVNEKLKRIET